MTSNTAATAAVAFVSSTVSLVSLDEVTKILSFLIAAISFVLLMIQVIKKVVSKFKESKAKLAKMYADAKADGIVSESERKALAEAAKQDAGEVINLIHDGLGELKDVATEAKEASKDVK